MPVPLTLDAWGSFVGRKTRRAQAAEVERSIDGIERMRDQALAMRLPSLPT
jgi:hypothetical protein